eukprot:scaffold85232_cov21-Tisochrysis_lutea.AAC.4
MRRGKGASNKQASGMHRQRAGEGPKKGRTMSKMMRRSKQVNCMEVPARTLHNHALTGGPQVDSLRSGFVRANLSARAGTFTTAQPSLFMTIHLPLHTCVHLWLAGPLSAAGNSEGGKRTGKDKNGFEVVPQQKRTKGDDSDGSGTDSDDEFDALDDQVCRCVGVCGFWCGWVGVQDACTGMENVRSQDLKEQTKLSES